MAKKDEKTEPETPKRVLATGASGDPEHPELGAPVGAETYFDTAPVTDTVTDAKKTRKDQE